MSLADDYRRQRAWRDWPRVLDALPPLAGRLVLDLGCGVGDPAAELAARGARVIGIDSNEELLREARSRSIDGAEFRDHDLRDLPELGVAADGIWCSLTAAYFPDLPAVLRAWARALKPGGWLALTEIDDLFGHEPLGAEARAVFDAYAREALAASRYDFHMGRKLRGHVEASGFTVVRELTLGDGELAFSGPASPEVIDAWRARLDRLKPLRQLCGERFEAIREELLGCLASPDHRCRATVRSCIATR